MQVSAHADHWVKALTTQLTGHAMLQLRLIKGAYSAEHLQHVARSSTDYVSSWMKNKFLFNNLLRTRC